MIFVFWLAWIVSEMGPASFDAIDARFEQRRAHERVYTHGAPSPARALIAQLEARYAA
jgi:hypothetical protein